MIKIEIRNVKSQIVGQLDPRVVTRLYNTLAAEVVGAFFAQQKNRWWDGKTHFFSKATLEFPTGMVHYVRNVLEKFHIEYEQVDLRQKPPVNPSLPLNNVILRPYQQQIVDEAVMRERGIIRVSTGGGKTVILSAIIGKQNLTTLIIIHRQEILQQIKETLERILQVPIGMVGNGVVDIQKITVAMVQSAHELKEFLPTVEALHFDEGHHCPCETYWEVAQAAKNAYYRFLYTGSDWREDNMDIMLEGTAAKKFIDITASKLIDDGYLVPPTIYLYNFKHETKDRKGVRYADIYDQEVTNNIERNQLVVDIALKAVKAGKSTLILINYIEHGENILALLEKVYPEAVFIHGQTDSVKRQKVLQEFKEGTRKLIIASNIMGEGVDIPRLDVLLTCKAEASTISAYQALGRTLRLSKGKTKAFVVDICDSGVKYLKSHATARHEIYSTEPRYVIKKVNGVEDLTFF